MVDESALRREFRAVLLALPAMTLAQLAREGEAFELPAPKAGAARPPLWVREVLRPLNESRNASGLIQSSGQIIYGVYRPETRFLEEGETLARAIAEAFEGGTNIALGDNGIHVDHCDRSSWIGDSNHPGWSFKAVTLLWRVHTAASI